MKYACIIYTAGNKACRVCNVWYSDPAESQASLLQIQNVVSLLCADYWQEIVIADLQSLELDTMFSHSDWEGKGPCAIVPLT